MLILQGVVAVLSTVNAILEWNGYIKEQKKKRYESCYNIIIEETGNRKNRQKNFRCTKQADTGFHKIDLSDNLC